MKILKPVEGKITSHFGERIHPITKKKSFHNGVDIAVPIGTAIIAPFDGKVRHILTNSIGGLQLILENKNGWKCGFAHLSEVKLKIGDEVKAGETVCLSGNTGRSKGAHLHFTLTNAQNSKVNPVLYFL